MPGSEDPNFPDWFSDDELEIRLKEWQIVGLTVYAAKSTYWDNGVNKVCTAIGVSEGEGFGSWQKKYFQDGSKWESRPSAISRPSLRWNADAALDRERRLSRQRKKNTSKR